MHADSELATAPTGDGPVTRSGRRLDARSIVSRLIAVHALLILLVAFAVLFSVLLPSTFPTRFNLQSILSVKAVIGLLALAVVVPLVAGNFDLSVGFGIGLAHILAVGLQVNQGLNWPAAVAIVLVVGALIGLINGVLVAFAKINSLIATLGAGTVVFGISNWYTGGAQVQGPLPEGFTSIATTKVFALPMPFLYLVGIAVVLWLFLEFLPGGRRLYAIGANDRAARLVGIEVERHVVLAFVASGVLVAIAGVILAAQIRIGQSNIGANFLLPAFVAALLGATSVRPGRVNVWGTVIAVFLLAVGISGLQQMGAEFWVEPVFNGSTLVLAVGLSGYVARRRLAAAQRRTWRTGEEGRPETAAAGDALGGNHRIGLDGAHARPGGQEARPNALAHEKEQA